MIFSKNNLFESFSVFGDKMEWTDPFLLIIKPKFE